jgi:hypothetical protein
MALNGSSFGAASSLEDYERDSDLYDEKDHPSYPSLPPMIASAHDIGLGSPPSYDADEDYTNLPPAVQIKRIPTGGVAPFEGGIDNEYGHGDMSMAGNGGRKSITY